MLIDLATAAQLVNRHERIIRGWILSGRLDVHPLPFQVSTGDLLKVGHLTSDDIQRIQTYVAEHSQKESISITLKEDVEATYIAQLAAISEYCSRRFDELDADEE
jgi:hypothetical protein